MFGGDLPYEVRSTVVLRLVGTLTEGLLCSGGRIISLFLGCNLENIVQSTSHCSAPPPAHHALRVSVHMQQQALVAKIER
jgi:hypothetical protein